MIEEPRWVSLATLHLLHHWQVERFGGLNGVRDEGVLSSAIARPINRFHYEPDLDIADLAATYLIGLARQQGFLDGNKRTAALTSLMFLAEAGYKIDVPQAELFAITLAAANNSITVEAAAAWTRERMMPGNY